MLKNTHASHPPYFRKPSHSKNSCIKPYFWYVIVRTCALCQLAKIIHDSAWRGFSWWYNCWQLSECSITLLYSALNGRQGLNEINQVSCGHRYAVLLYTNMHKQIVQRQNYLYTGFEWDRHHKNHILKHCWKITKQNGIQYRNWVSKRKCHVHSQQTQMYRYYEHKKIRSETVFHQHIINIHIYHLILCGWSFTNISDLWKYRLLRNSSLIT